MSEISKYPWIKPTNLSELRALVGLLYSRGLYRMNYHSLNIWFSDKTGPSIFSATMSRDRMQFLLSRLIFDDSEERKEKWSYDRFAAAYPLLEMFNSNTSNTCCHPYIYQLTKPINPLTLWDTKRGRPIQHRFDRRSCSLFSQSN